MRNWIQALCKGDSGPYSPIWAPNEGTRFYNSCSGGAGKRLLLLLSTMIVGTVPMIQDANAQDETAVNPVIVVHGGAGTILRGEMTPELEAQYREKLAEALQAGYAVLEEGGSSLDAVEQAIRILEDSPLFNAGRGAVFTSAGTVELDASIMDGSDLSAGAVAGVRHIEHPISLARLVMTASPHVLLTGEGAEEFAREQGIELVPNEFFYTPRRREQLDRIQQREREGPPPTGAVQDRPGVSDATDHKYGTVGAVALNRNGNLAAGTSTGGMTNKRFGRVGDSPIIGAGTYADNAACAVSATGHGEYFIRGVIAYTVAALMQYAGLPLQEAAAAAIHGKLEAMGGTGGVIALDRQGNIAMPFNTAGMYRGYIDRDGEMVIEFYRD